MTFPPELFINRPRLVQPLNVEEVRGDFDAGAEVGDL